MSDGASGGHPGTAGSSPEASSARGRRPKRPVSVSVVAAVAIAVAAYSLIYGVLAIEGGERNRLLEGIFYLAFGAGTLAAAIGALRLKAWAWVAFMSWAVLGLTVQILRHFFFDDPNYTAMAINTFAVLAMSPLDVQVAFGLRHTRNVQLARPTRNPVDRD